MSRGTLHIATDLSLPLDAVTQKFSFLGRTGSGKTFGATKMCEEMLDAGAQVIVIDPVGVWYGLRVGGSFSIRIFGGLHGDVPLEPGAGEFIANLLVDRGISAVLDVSQFESDALKAKFARDFATRFFFRKKAAPSAVHLFLEEAQEFVPQNPQRDEAMMVHAFQRLAKLGRNFGIGLTLISQRPQEVNKKALNQTECLMAFQMTGPQERKAIETWIAEKGVNEDIRELLPHLNVGECHVWSPQWLQVNKTVKIARKRSADVSSTPSAGGAKRAEPKPLADSELADLAKEMSATIDRAKAEDPRELRKKIGQLEKELRESRGAAAARPPQKVEVPVLKEPQIKRLEAACRQMDKLIAIVAEGLKPVEAGLATIAGHYAHEARKKPVLARVPMMEYAPPHPIITGKSGELAKVHFQKRGVGTLPPGEVVTKPQQRILQVLTSFLAMGLDAVSKSNVAVFAGASPTSGGFRNNLGSLRTAGLISYPRDGYVAITGEGAKYAGESEQIASLRELHNAWYVKLPNPQARILQVLVHCYPESMSREQLAGLVGASVTSGGFRNNLGALRSLGVIDYPADGQVVATALLFPEGLH